VAAAFLCLVACTGGGGGGSGATSERIDAPGVDREVVLVAPSAHGAGKIPTFRWRPLQGATQYRLAVLDRRGQVLWAWAGAETSVPLGGVANRREGRPGPVLTPGSTWSVVALEDGRVVGVGEVRPVSP